MFRRVHVHLLIAALVFSALGLFGTAEAAYPERDIRYIVPYAPGGNSDVTARLLADVIRKKELLPVNLLVTNIDGASAGAGMLEVRDARPDGYTLLHHHTSLITHEVFGIRDWGFEAYTPVAMLFEIPAAIVVPGDSPFQTMEQLVEAVKAQPGAYSWNVSSLGGGAHLVSEVIMDALGISKDIRLVAYGSGGAATRAILAGEDTVSGNLLNQVVPYLEEGSMRMLAVGSLERLPEFPDVPTLAELGIDTPLRVSHRMGVWAPPGTPREIVDYLYEVFAAAVESEEFREAAARMGFVPRLGTPEELVAQFREDRRAIAEVVEALGL